MTNLSRGSLGGLFDADGNGKLVAPMLVALAPFTCKIYSNGGSSGETDDGGSGGENDRDGIFSASSVSFVGFPSWWCLCLCLVAVNGATTGLVF